MTSILNITLQKIKQFLGSPTGTLFKIFFSLSLIFFFINSIDIHKVKQLILGIKPIFLFYIFACILIRNHISAFRFKIIAHKFQEISVWLLNKHYFIASMFNVFLPTTIGGDAVRVFLLEQEKMTKKTSLLLILVERFIGFFAFTFLALIGLLLTDLPLIVNLIVIGVNLGFIFLALILFSDLFTFSFLQKIKEKFKGLKFIAQQKDTLLYTLIISLLYQLVSIFIRYLVAISFGIEVSFTLFLVFIPLINLVTLLPISFGGLGLRELAFIYFFTQIGGLTEESSIVMSLGTYIILVITGLIGALCYLYDQIFLNIAYQFNKNEETNK